MQLRASMGKAKGNMSLLTPFKVRRDSRVHNFHAIYGNELRAQAQGSLCPNSVFGYLDQDLCT